VACATDDLEHTPVFEQNTAKPHVAPQQGGQCSTTLFIAWLLASICMHYNSDSGNVWVAQDAFNQVV
jgi:hypothetical protein